LTKIKPTEKNCNENGDKAIVEVETISSGSLGIDLALGVGGYPRGRIIEIYGRIIWKTTLTLHAIAEAQKQVELLHLLMQSMHSTEIMLKIRSRY
jgi:RecA/RadA recombinase